MLIGGWTLSVDIDVDVVKLGDGVLITKPSGVGGDEPVLVVRIQN